jgi:hypothetical protein
VIHEMICKNKIYTNDYVNQLKSFVGLSLSRGEINRILWGNDLAPNNVNNRPLSKLIQDIYEDL